MKLTVRISLCLAFAVLLLASCQKNLTNVPSLVIKSLSATTAPANATIAINGTGFSAAWTADRVYFNGKPAIITAVSDTQIMVIVPTGAGTGPVSVTVNGSVAAMGPIFNYQTTAVVTTVAGGATAGLNNGAALSATFTQLWGIAVDSKGNIFTSEYTPTGTIRELSQGMVNTFAGNNKGHADGTGIAAGFSRPWGMSISSNDNLYVAEGSRVRKITAGAVVTSIDVPGAVNISAVAVDAGGNIFSADEQLNKIFKTTPAGITTVLAGSGTSASVDGTGTAACFKNLMGMTIDKQGNLYVVDMGSSTIRKVTQDGTVKTIAGNGLSGLADGLGTAASFSLPTGIAIDGAGNLYVADTFNNKIRKITPNGMVTTVAGDGATGSTDGMARAATFNHPNGLTVDASGNIYVTEYSEIRRISFQ